MGISKFMILLIIFTLIFLLIEKDNTVAKVQQKTKPKVSFYDSTMYEITEENIKQIVKSKQADIYDEREELIDATIVVKSDDSSYNNDIASSNSMIKKGDKVFLRDNVNLQLADGTNIKTEQLDYNVNTKIASNNVPFTAIRDNDTFKGDTLFFDGVSDHIEVNKVKFRMKVENQ